MTSTSAPLWCIVSCKGRLMHLRRTLPTLLAQRNVICCVVDFDCPDRCGDWASATFPDELRDGRLVIERVVDRPIFDKSTAQNAGAARAMREGAEHLLFVDADTLIAPGLTEWLHPQLDASRFWIVARRPDGYDERDLFGFLVVPARALVEAGGFDESLAGWGGEDLDLRLQLLLRVRLQFGEVPIHFLRAIPHDDALRTEFFAEPDVRASNRANQKRIIKKLYAQFGLHPYVIRVMSYRMWCRLPKSPEQRPGYEPLHRLDPLSEPTTLRADLDVAS